MTSPSDNAPAFFSFIRGGASKKGEGASQKGKAGKTSQGETKDQGLVGAARRWAGVGERKEEVEVKTECSEKGSEEGGNKSKQEKSQGKQRCEYEWCNPVRYCRETGLNKGKGYLGYKGTGTPRVCHVATCPQGCTPYQYGGISAIGYKQKLRDFLGENKGSVSRGTEKDAWESALGNIPKIEQEVSEEEQKIEG